MSARRRWTGTAARVGALAALATAVLLAGACSLVVGLDKFVIGEGGAGGSARTCDNAAQCDDHNPCTDDGCGADGVCVSTPLNQGIDGGVVAPPGAQTLGDCKTVVCVHGEPQSDEDDTDVPVDHNDCTLDQCDAQGMPENPAEPDGTPCADATATAGHCVAGVCTVECSPTMSCTNGNSCAVATCDIATGTCVSTPLPDGMPTPGVDNVPGDCHVHVCVGGVDTNLEDDSDVPTTPTDCDLEECNGGTPSNPPKPLDTPCSTFRGSGSGFCDGAGTCVACTMDSECPGVNDDCQHQTCATNLCQTVFTSSGTATTAQTPFDCHVVVCDGSGGTMTVVDDTDLPDDGDACTNDLCTNGVASHTNKAAGTACGTSLVCSAANPSECTGCTLDSQCVSPVLAHDTCGGGNPGTAHVCGCTKTTCVAQGKTCGTIPDACYSTLDCDSGTKNGGETDVDCGGPVTGCATRCAQGKACSAGSDCANGFCADGVCCNTACTGLCQACTALKKGSGGDGVCGAIAANTDPDSECAMQASSTCGTTGSCDGAGACQMYATGTTCVAASCNGAVVNNPQTCNGSGTCSTATTTACALYTCAAGACKTSCAADTDCAPTAYCVGQACVARSANGHACTAADQCTSGFCVDGFCCNAVCNGACVACAAALKNTGLNDGTCGAVKNGTDPHTSCPAGTMASCGNDGTCQGGACHKWVSGTVCVGASCMTGSQATQGTCNGSGACAGSTVTPCTPYVCGPTACLTACGAAGNSVDCISTDYCDGVGGGACQPKKASGGACTAPYQCTSGACTAGVCG